MEAKRWFPAVLLLAGLAVGVPIVASASSVDTKLQIGVDLHFTGPASSAGTFVAAGSVRDSGSVVVSQTFVQQGNQDDARLTGTQVFTGQKGSFTATFKGLTGPLNDPHQAATGTFAISGGTGAYAGLQAHGTFTVVIDFPTNQIVGTQVGEAG
jgi:hypothetical protein